MNAAVLVTCMVWFTSCEVQTSQPEISRKWTQPRQKICSVEDNDCIEIQRKLQSVLEAAYEQDWEYVRSFIQNGFYLDTVDPEGRSLAMMAAESGQWEMVHWLREKGADINLQDDLQRSVLHVASSHCQWHEMKMLVTNGSNVNAVDSLGRTPTIMAASYKEWDTVQWLIEKGANINARDGFGRSILLLAASHNNWKFVKWLLSKGADPQVIDQNRRTLLHLSAIADNLEIAQILVENFYADFNQEDKNGNTPMNLAAVNSDPKGLVYKYLVYMRDVKTNTSIYRRDNTEYKIKELTLINRVTKMYETINAGESSLNIKMFGKVILVLGNLKSGKSTLIKFLTEDTSKLTSQPVVEGSGHFKIVPINGTTIPTSVHPTLVNYKEKGVVFCDGPRFSDMGIISQDLTSMHFLKKAADKFKRVKLVFTVSHLAVKRGMNAEEFITFLQHSTNFITNFTHFSESSCIVVTKFDGPKMEVADTQLERAAEISLSKAAESMTEELNEKDLPAEKIIFYKKALDFLLMIVRKNRIRVFRRPKSAGPLDKFPRMTWAKDRLSKFIFDEISYVKVKRSHFDYPLSDKILTTIHKFEQATNRETTSAMANIANHIENQLFSRARNSDEIFKTHLRFQEACKRIEEIMKLIAEKDSSRSILLTIRMSLEHVKIYPRRIDSHKIERLNKFFEFLQKITKNKLKTTPWEWRDPFRMLLISIRQTRDWYEFLNFLYQHLITYDIQVNRGTYDANSPSNWGRIHKAEKPGISIDQNNVESFLKVMLRYNIRRTGAIKIRHFHDFEIDSLNRILQFTIKDKIFMDCKNGLFTGSYISVRSAYFNCKESDSPLETMKIFATNTIFIDHSVELIKDVIMIAPTVEVKGEITFNFYYNGSFRLIAKNRINMNLFHAIFSGPSITELQDSDEQVMVYAMQDTPESLPEYINQYLDFSIDHLKNSFVSSKLLGFLEEIATSPQILKHYTTATLLNDLLELENKYNSFKGKIDFLPLYESLLKRIDTYTNNPISDEDSSSYKLAQTHLYTVVMSKVSSLKQDRRDNLVLNIAEFFKLSKYIIEEIAEKGNQIAATQFKEKFQDDIQKQIEEGQEMVTNQVRSAVDKIFVKINETTQSLITSVQKKIKELEKYKEELEDYKEELERYLSIKKAFGILGFIGQAVSSLGSYGAAASALIGAGCAIANAANKHPGPMPQKDLSLPKAVSNSAGKVLAYGAQDAESAINAINEFEEEVEKKDTNARKEIMSHLDKARSILKKVIDVSKEADFEKVAETINTVCLENEGILNTYYNKIKNSEIVTKISSFAPELSQFKTAMSMVANGAVEIVAIVTQGEGELEQLDQQIKQVENNIKQLKEFETKIKTEMFPMIKDMKKDMDKAQDRLKDLSSLQLSMASWKLGNVLRDSQRKLSMMTEGFDEQEDMIAHVEDLRAAMDIQITIFQKLQDYMEQSKMVAYMNDISNPDYFKAGYPQEIKKDMNNLDLMISSNILLSHRSRAMGALKQWVFPFAHDYLGAFQTPKQLNYKSNITDLVKRAKEELEKIQMTILTGAAVPTKRDRCTLNTDFYQKNPKGPFYIWKNSENPDFIISILSGEEVTANVDIRMKLKFNAVKFRYIKLTFYARNEMKQQELDKLLRNFEVKMIHLGNSHFHCDGKIYTMTSSSLEIRYSLHEDPPGKHTTMSEIVLKLRKGDVMLSPYATWKFQLVDSTNEGKFGKLLAFIDDVDIIFEGEGQYLNDDCISQCSIHVDDYYKVDGTV